MTLFLMHITKTAGGSLKQLLRSAATNGEDIRFHYAEEPGFRHYLDYPDVPKVFFGHYSYGVHNRMGLPARYACILRDPIPRTISHYHHLKNNDNGPAGERLRQFESMEQYLKFSRYWEFDNFLTRTISGISNGQPFGSIGYDAYNRARNNLRSGFEYVGIFEHLNESIERLRKFVRIPATTLPSVNIGNYTQDISSEELRLLKALNRFDDLLYEEALELFEKQPRLT